MYREIIIVLILLPIHCVGALLCVFILLPQLLSGMSCCQGHFDIPYAHISVSMSPTITVGQSYLGPSTFNRNTICQPSHVNVG